MASIHYCRELLATPSIAPLQQDPADDNNACRLTSPLRNKDQLKSHLDAYAQCIKSRRGTISASLPGLASSRTLLACLLWMLESIVLQTSLMPLRLLSAKHMKERLVMTEAAIRAQFWTLRNLTARNWLQGGFLTPLEFANLVWSCYLLAALHQLCLHGGSLDFEQINVARVLLWKSTGLSVQSFTAW